MYDMFDQMMRSPWFYVALIGLIVVVALIPLLGIRVLARREVNDDIPTRDEHPADQSADPRRRPVTRRAPRRRR